MRKILTILAIPALVLLMAGGSGECDLATVVKGFYCETDYQILEEKDLVSDKTYYVCPDCEAIETSPGTCSFCEVELVKRQSGKHVCPQCFQKPTAVEICVKKYHACPSCDAPGEAGGTCPDCEEPYEQMVSRALVQYECDSCGYTSYTAGTCPSEDCEAQGKPLHRRCELSGEFPHTGK
jgi:hypothetical protein